MKPNQRYIHRKNGSVMFVRLQLESGSYMTSKGVMTAEEIERDYIPKNREKEVTSIQITRKERELAKAKHGSLRKCFLKGLES